MYPTWPSQKLCAMLGQKSARPFISSSSEPQWGLNLIKSLLSLLFLIEQKKKERWEEAVNSIDFSHSSRKAWRTTHKLTGRSGRSFRLCPSQPTPSSHNSWRTGHTRPGVASPGSPTRSFPTYGRSRHPRETASLAPSRHGGPSCCPQVPEASKVPGSGSYLPGVFTPRRVGFQSLVLWFPHVLLKIPTIWRRALIVAMPKPEKPLKDPKSYRPMSLLCPLQDPQETHLRFYRSNHQPIAPAVACRLLTREVERRPGHPADTGHRG